MQSSNVQVGQIWVDNDKRRVGRKLKIKSLKGKQVDCEVISKSPFTKNGKKFVRIKLERFRPWANGYSLEKNSRADFQSVFHNMLKNDWGLVNYNTAILKKESLTVVVRCTGLMFDVKYYIEDNIVDSIFSKDLEEALDKVERNLLRICENICNVLHGGLYE
jgi:hypothetical protein